MSAGPVAAVARLAQPGWLQFAALVLLADLANYAGHRAWHEIGPLWRLHAVHHSRPTWTGCPPAAVRAS
ncbi:sterol desaturase family protein [Frankia sp. AgKG'84/4]|uniref:sterol desaturase family protein n=1 Tax=Frankia sp. AgKG'84/4 TaxID=573490 RepID=UPI00200F26E7|nr:sterol desaturase family protein [Frankia sp. AgKG'84/4]MCL9793964.1 sterol desaturase family protein [Frankia sp. AgKG'84/4]